MAVVTSSGRKLWAVLLVLAACQHPHQKLVRPAPGQPLSGQARVHVLLSHEDTMALDLPLIPTVGYPIWIDASQIGRLWFDRYMVFDRAPGELALGIDEAARKTYLKLALEPNRTYYIKPTPAGVSAWTFVVLAAAEGASLVEGMEPVPVEP